jgi:hypothetical protein
VREYDRNAPLDLALFIDPWLPTVPNPAATAQLERMLCIAVSIAWAWVNAELPGKVTLMVAGPEWVVAHGQGTPGFIRREFIPLGTTQGETHIGSPPVDAIRQTARASRVLLSTRENSPMIGHVRTAGLTVAAWHPGIAPVWYVPRRDGTVGY